MYLCDDHIEAQLDQLQFETTDPARPFEPKNQIQPASIDLRLGDVFWQQRNGLGLDIRKTKLLELSPRRHWRKMKLSESDGILLKPGQMLLGRTFEKFSIPATCAGKLEGRSSFARMGLSVQCSADFINPGYRGHMPLQLVNHGRETIRLVPFVPICQLVLIQLSKEPGRLYGKEELFSKYMDDDGGPSYWWRDKRVKDVLEKLRGCDVVQRIQDEILNIIGPQEPEVIERFDNMLDSAQCRYLTNSIDILNEFSKHENSAFFRYKLKRAIIYGSGIIMLPASIGIIFATLPGQSSYSWAHYLLWTLTVPSVWLSIQGLRSNPVDFLTSDKMSRLISEYEFESTRA